MIITILGSTRGDDGRYRLGNGTFFTVDGDVIASRVLGLSAPGSLPPPRTLTVNKKSLQLKIFSSICKSKCRHPP